MGGSTPTISVLMSVYNSERYLREAVESILRQTFTDFEFLIVDDGSTDRSLDILQAYAAQDPRIVLISRENRGLTQTLNELVSRSSGKFLARMDADDVALPERFADQVAFLNQHPQVVCLGTAQEWIDGEGEILMHCSPAADNDEIQAHMLAGRNYFCHPSVMMRRQAVVTVGGYDISLQSAQDLDLWLKLGEIGKLANLQKVLMRYRIHAGSVTEKRIKQQTGYARAACERAWERRQIAGRYEVAPSWRHSLTLQFGWQMFNKGQRRKAIAYGMQAVKAMPSDVESWKLLTCALIKPFSHSTAQ
ncbi:glycosyltransferase [Phormidium tenue FACHB-886]|nr:glycosyltransferase [Phormidium tenue FACHB-886]